MSRCLLPAASALIVVAVGCGARTGLDLGGRDGGPSISSDGGDGGADVGPPPRRELLQLAAGYGFTCALRSDGTVLCWGFNESGTLGDGTTESRPEPRPVEGLDDATFLATAGHRVCAARSDGTVACWGAIPQPDGEREVTPRPAPVSDLEDIISIAVSAAHACALDRSGGVHCWGHGFSGQLGTGIVDYQERPLPIPDMVEALAVATGEGFTCILSVDALALCWGSNANHRSGGGDDGTVLLWGRAVPGSEEAMHLSLGLSHGCVASSRGDARCWGENLEGCLGYDTSYCCSPEARRVDMPGRVVEVSAAYPHSCARTRNGRVFCFGLNSFGQLGSDAESGSGPSRVEGLEDATHIAAGEYHNCAIRETGDVVCWGSNRYGELGLGTDARESSTPVVALPAE